MATMNISVPEDMRQWVEKQARSRRYSKTSDYVHDLIRRDQEQAVKIAHMQALVTEGLESGTGERTGEELRETTREKAAGS